MSAHRKVSFDTGIQTEIQVTVVMSLVTKYSPCRVSARRDEYFVQDSKIDYIYLVFKM